MHLVSDNPAVVDRFGDWGKLPNTLAEVIITAAPPFTLGLFGEWGSGKTTLMRMVDDQVRASKGKTVWFNAWKYDGKEVIWNALIQAVFYTMREDQEIKSKSNKEDFRKKVGAEPPFRWQNMLQK